MAEDGINKEKDVEQQSIPFVYTTDMADHDHAFELLDKGFIPAPFLAGECFKGGVNPMQFGDGIPVYDKAEIERVRMSDPNGRTEYFGKPLGFDMAGTGEIIKVSFDEIKDLFEHPDVYREAFDLDNLYFVKYTDSPLNVPIIDKDKPIDKDFRIFNICTLYAYMDEDGAETIQDKKSLPAMLTLVTDSAGKVHHALGLTRSESPVDIGKTRDDFASLRIPPSIIDQHKIDIPALADEGVTVDMAPAIENFKQIAKPFEQLVQDMLPSIIQKQEFAAERMEEARDAHVIRYSAAESMDLQTYSARESLIFASQRTGQNFANYESAIRGVESLSSSMDAASYNGDGRTIAGTRTESNAELTIFNGLCNQNRQAGNLIDELCGPGQRAGTERLDAFLTLSESKGDVYKAVADYSQKIIEVGRGSLPTSIRLTDDPEIKQGMTREIANAVTVANSGGRYKDTGFRFTANGVSGNGAWEKLDGNVVLNGKQNERNDRYITDKESGIVYDKDTGLAVMPDHVLDTYATNFIQDEIRDTFREYATEAKCRLLYDNFYHPEKVGAERLDYPAFKDNLEKNQLSVYEKLSGMDKSERLTIGDSGFHLSKNGNPVCHRAFNVRVVDKAVLDRWAGRDFSALDSYAKCDILFDNLLSKPVKGTAENPISKEIEKRVEAKLRTDEHNGFKVSDDEKDRYVQSIRDNAKEEIRAEFTSAMMETALEHYEQAHEEIFERIDHWYKKEDIILSKDGEFRINFTGTDKNGIERNVTLSVLGGKVSGTAAVSNDTANPPILLASWKDVSNFVKDSASVSDITVPRNASNGESVSVNESLEQRIKDFLTDDKKQSMVISRGYRYGSYAGEQPAVTNTDDGDDRKGYFDVDAYKSFVNSMMDSCSKDTNEDKNTREKIEYNRKEYAERVLTGDVDIDDRKQMRLAYEGRLYHEDKDNDVVKDSSPNTENSIDGQPARQADDVPVLDSMANTRSIVINYDEAGQPFIMTYGRTNPNVKIAPDGKGLVLPTGKEDPKTAPVDAGIAKWKLDKILDSVEHRVQAEGLDTSDKRALIDKETAEVKKELRGYLADAKMWESVMERMNIPRTQANKHYGYQYAKLQHTYAVYSYERAGGAVGKDQAVTQGIGMLALNAARTDFFRTNVASTMLINHMALSDAKGRADRYVKNHETDIRVAARSDIEKKYNVIQLNDPNRVMVNGHVELKEEYDSRINKEADSLAKDRMDSIRESIIDRNRFANPFSIPDMYVDAHGDKHTITAYDKSNIIYNTLSIGFMAAYAAFSLTLPGGIGILLAAVAGNAIVLGFEHGTTFLADARIERGYVRADNVQKDTVNHGLMEKIKEIIAQGGKIADAIRDGIADIRIERNGQEEAVSRDDADEKIDADDGMADRAEQETDNSDIVRDEDVDAISESGQYSVDELDDDNPQNEQDSVANADEDIPPDEQEVVAETDNDSEEGITNDDSSDSVSSSDKTDEAEEDKQDVSSDISRENDSDTDNVPSDADTADIYEEEVDIVPVVEEDVDYDIGSLSQEEQAEQYHDPDEEAYIAALVEEAVQRRESDTEKDPQVPPVYNVVTDEQEETDSKAVHSDKPDSKENKKDEQKQISSGIAREEPGRDEVDRDEISESVISHEPEYDIPVTPLETGNPEEIYIPDDMSEFIQETIFGMVDVAESCFTSNSDMPVTEFKDILESVTEDLETMTGSSQKSELTAGICRVIADHVDSDTSNNPHSDTKTLAADMVIAMTQVFYGSDALSLASGYVTVMNGFDQDMRKELEPAVTEHMDDISLREYELTSVIGGEEIIYGMDGEDDIIGDYDTGAPMDPDIGDSYIISDAMTASDIVANAFDTAKDAADNIVLDIESDGGIVDEMQTRNLFYGLMEDIVTQPEPENATNYEDLMYDNPSVLEDVLAGQTEMPIHDLIVHPDTEDDAAELIDRDNMYEPEIDNVDYGDMPDYSTYDDRQDDFDPYTQTVAQDDDSEKDDFDDEQPVYVARDEDGDGEDGD